MVGSSIYGTFFIDRNVYPREVLMGKRISSDWQFLCHIQSISATINYKNYKTESTVIYTLSDWKLEESCKLYLSLRIPIPSINMFQSGIQPPVSMYCKRVPVHCTSCSTCSLMRLFYKLTMTNMFRHMSVLLTHPTTHLALLTALSMLDVNWRS